MSSARKAHRLHGEQWNGWAHWQGDAAVGDHADQAGDIEREVLGDVPVRESGVGERVEMPKVLNDLDLAQNQLNNARIQNLATAPASPVEGQIYHNTVDHKTYVYNGSAWVDVTIAANGDVTVTFATLKGANTIRVKIAG